MYKLLNDEFCNIATVKEETGLSEEKIYHFEEYGLLPKRISKPTENDKWLSSDICAFIINFALPSAHKYQ